MGSRINYVGRKIANGVEVFIYKHPVVTCGLYVAACAGVTVGCYKLLGNMVAKRVVKALI